MGRKWYGPKCFMRLKSRCLAINHHAVCYQDPDGSLWLPSFMGRWVDAIAEHTGEIRLLMHRTEQRSATRQDYRLKAKNIHLFGMGPPGRRWDRIPRMRRIRAACLHASQGADGLLIRGSTPRQLPVWRWTNVPRNAYLLVGSLYERNASEPRISFSSLYTFFMKLHRRRELRVIARESLLLANYPQLALEVRKACGKRASFVPTNTLSASEFPSFQNHVPSLPLRILFCGRVVREKGIIELVRSVGLLSKQGLPCVLDVVGEFANEMRIEIERTALESNVACHVVLHGPIPYGPELFSFYRRAGVFALPTYSEGFPHAIWEAAAHSCPVVTCSVGGIPALWKNEVHGLTIQPRHPEQIAAAILRIRRDPDLRRRLTESAYRHALNFTVEICAFELATVLSQLWEHQS